RVLRRGGGPVDRRPRVPGPVVGPGAAEGQAGASGSGGAPRGGSPARAGGRPRLTEVRTAPVGRDTLLMSAGTLVSRLTGFGRWAALAYAIGFTRLTDAYNLANTTPNIVFDLVLGGVLAATLIPVFVDRLARPGGTARGEEEAWEA